MMGSGESLRTTQAWRGARAALLALLLGFVLAACGGGTPSEESPESPATGDDGATTGTEVVISDFAFGPQTLTVDVGTTVTWTNEDAVVHTVTADDGSFDSGNLSTGDTFSQTFDTAGTYSYHCTPHPNMTAEVVVE